MRCYGYGLTTIPFPSTVSGSRFFCLTAANPISFSSISRIRPGPVKFPTRNAVAGSLKLKVKSSLNDGFMALDASQSQMSFYELLGVPESGSLVEVKHAYKQLARKYHPDVSPAGRVDEYTKRFIQVQEAYETLSDPTRRAMYDRDMAKGLHVVFSSRRRYYNDDLVTEQKNEWKTRWKSQLSELKRRSNCKESGGNMSWAARMRQKRDGIASEL